MMNGCRLVYGQYQISIQREREKRTSEATFFLQIWDQDGWPNVLNRANQAYARTAFPVDEATQKVHPFLVSSFRAGEIDRERKLRCEEHPKKNKANYIPELLCSRK